jgi:ribosomal protein S18 acetylase RimI-like enzyme
MTVKRFSDAELAAGVEADLVAHVSTLYPEPADAGHADNSVIWFKTGIASPYSNGILRSSVPRDQETVASILAPFEESLPLMWWFFTPPSEPPAEDVMTESGFTLDSDRPSMAVHVNDLRGKAAPQSAVVERVADEAQFDRWTEVVTAGFGAPDLADGTSNAAFRRLGFSSTAPFQHFVCEVDGVPVSAVTLAPRGAFAGVANMATLPDQRGRGLGSFVLTEGVAALADRGIAAVVLSADELGARLYSSLGFHEVGRHLTYVRGTA